MSKKSQERLIESVIEMGICVKCGACSGYCPYMKYYDGRVIIVDRCNLENGRCELVCPMLSLGDLAVDEERPIGDYRDILIARARDESIRGNAQYGGVVSALLVYLLEKGLVKSAVLTTKGDNLSPKGILVKQRDGVIDCSGSRYSASGALECLNMAIKDGEKGISVVGLPCQMKAIDGIRATHDAWDEKNLSLKIGLFCTWALDYRNFHSFLVEKLGIAEQIMGFDITPPPEQIFKVFVQGRGIDIPLDEVRPFVQSGCNLCDDMTSERADISVGAVEGKEGWNTVIIRTDKGAEVMDMAIKDGILETDEMPEDKFSHLREASLNKKIRAENNRNQMGKR